MDKYEIISTYPKELFLFDQPFLMFFIALRLGVKDTQPFPVAEEYLNCIKMN